MQNHYGHQPEPSLVSRCREWIERNVPSYTRAEYEALLLTNQDLMVRLIAKCLAFEDLLKEYHRLQDDVARTMPMPPFTVRADMHIDTLQMRDTVFTLTWGMDQMRQRVAVADHRSFRSRMHTASIAAAMRAHFERDISPQLWKQAEVCMMRAAA